MRLLSGTLLLGLVFTLVVLYFLPDAKPGAVALIALICTSMAGLLIKLIQSLLKRKTNK